MPITPPSITFARASATTFTATLSSADAGTSTLVYHRWQGPLGNDVLAATIVGTSGVAVITVQQENGQYLIWAYSVDAMGFASPPVVAGLSLSTPDSLSGLIVTKYLANAGLVALCPTIFFNEIPEFDANNEPIRPPFVLLRIPEEKPDWTFERDYYDVCRGSLTVFAYTVEEADTIAAAIEAAFDWQPGMSGVFQAMRENSYGASDEMRDRDGKLVSYNTMEYQFMRVRRQAG